MKHPFHIVDPSPWPFTGAIGAFFLVVGLASGTHHYEAFLWKLGLLIIILTIFQWWRDIRREASLQGKHTHRVENGLRIGMILFITREILFFFSFFWAFFHSSLRPNVEIGSTWPPVGVVGLDPFEVPLLNTTLLLRRGASITWTHMALINNSWHEANIRFALTIGLGVAFTLLQYLEYIFSPFALSDSIYGRTFYVATGFHGLHVIIGTIFILVMWSRHLAAHFSGSHHYGFEASAWYWHFVDVVWLFLFICLYWWGS